MNKKYEIVKMHICSFDIVDESLLTNIEKYPARLCVFDKENKRVIDVKTMHEYPYLKVINMTYIPRKDNQKCIEFGKRYACIKRVTLLNFDLDSREIDECKNIINLLNLGYKFKDGNTELSNDQYLKMVNKKEKFNIMLKKRK